MPVEPKTTKPPRRKRVRPDNQQYEVTVPEQFLVEKNPFNGRELPVIPKGYVGRFSQEEMETHFLLAFMLRGGVSAFALWADENPTEFYKMYGKIASDRMMAKGSTPTQAIQINLQGNQSIPTSPLDDVVLRDESVVNANYRKIDE